MKLLFALLAGSVLVLAAGTGCKEATSAGDKLADSLSKLVDDIHGMGMGKMGKLSRVQVRTQQLIDSLDGLPAKFKTTTAPYRAKLDSFRTELAQSHIAMTSWMKEYYQDRRDTLKSDLHARIQYLRDQQAVAGKVTDDILNCIKKGDTLLHPHP